MKMKLTLFLSLFFCSLGNFYYTQAQGIHFTDKNWKSVLETASKENKLIFVDCYTEWCQPCKEMAKEVFTQKKVGDFFNKHFVNVKMDVEKGEGVVFLNTYRVNAFPTLLFLSAKGGEILSKVGKKSEDELLKIAAAVLTSDTQEQLDTSAQKQFDLFGQKIPDFCFPDINGNMVKFSSLRGKYVYIDIWATWCRPCCSEIPYMSQLEEKFHGRNIHFVSISCDKDQKAWKKKVLDENLGGIQLNCNSVPEFMKFFGIMGIPHFLLIDPEGKIVNPQMSRPSQKITEESLKSLEGI